MFHTKEVIGFEKPFQPHLSSDEISSDLSFSKVRFGDLKVDSLFFFNGVRLKKIDDYNAETDKKTGKEKFLFFKKDIVKIEQDKATNQTASKKLPESIWERDLSEHYQSDDSLLNHCDGSNNSTTFIDETCWNKLHKKIITISPRFHRDELEFEVVLGDKKASYLFKPSMVGDFYNWSFRFPAPMMGVSIEQKKNHLSVLFKDQLIWEYLLDLDFNWSHVSQLTINFEIK